MLPTALLMEIYEQQITPDEFERMLHVPDDVSQLNQSNQSSNPVSTSASCHDDNSSLSSSVSSMSPTPSNASYWRDLEMYSTSTSSTSSSTSSDESSSEDLVLKAQPRNQYFYKNQSGGSTKTKHHGKKYEVKKYCSFCFHNHENESVYTSHDLRDEARNISCPALFEVVCRYCGATGTEAHTPKYCPHKHVQRNVYTYSNF